MIRPDPAAAGGDENPELRLLRLVESFEDGWVAGAPTPLEDWLGAADGEDRDERLRHGLAVEVAHRRLRGEAPTAGDYLGRFPDRPSLIHEALADAPSGPDASGDRPDSGGTVLEALDRTAGPMPRVLLGEPRSADEGPVVRPSSPELPGTAARPARVQLLGEIARGAMGAVLKGCDPDLGRDLAVKVLLEEHRHRPDLIRRFVEEAQIGGQLQHPGVVPVYELGVFGDARPYFTMKLVRGQTLAGLLAARTDPSSELPRLLETFLRVAQTMAYAHARGVVHRDLKPSNIMVGSFGEVQVMDWGLAKVLPRGGAADDEAGDGREAAIATSWGDSELDRSRAGSVMGTPSYMAPEQAGGQIERVDERADVFALGSILCEILTGRPAFTGRSSDEVLRSARRADLSGALARLGACGADEGLIRLARACLAPAWEDRPRDAQAVADRMQSHLDGVHRRIREAELARAAEAARAEEARATAAAAEGRARAERQARRMTVGLAASILIAAAVVGAIWRGAELDRITRKGVISARVTAALQEAGRLKDKAREAPAGDLAPWVEALDAVGKAGELLETGPDPTLREQVESLRGAIVAEKRAAEVAARDRRADRALADRLVDIRSSRIDDPDGSLTDAGYARAFREAGIDVAVSPPAESAARIRARPSAPTIAAALDDWASVRRSRRLDRPGAMRLAEAANAIDPDPWRVGLRRALDADDPAPRGEAMRALASSADLEALPAVDLDLLGTSLAAAKEPEAAEAVLRAGRRRFPDDLWLNYDLARLLDSRSRREEAIRYYSIARALRPETALALALALERSGEADEAIAVFADLVRRRPDSGPNWACYGRLLKERGDRTGAAALEKGAAILREAVRLRPDDPDAHNDLSFALEHQGKREEAAAEIRTAIRLRPDDARFYRNLGVLLWNDPRGSAEAVAAFRTAIRLRPDDPDAHLNLGAAFHSRGRVAEAIDEFRTAVHLRPGDAHTHYNLGEELRLGGELEEAIVELRTAVRLAPDEASSRVGLGQALRLRGKWAAAAFEFREAIRLRPDDPDPRISLGQILFEVEHDYGGAVAEFREAIRLRPGEARAHTGLGIALGHQGKLAEAVSEFRTAIRLRPGEADAHSNLGVALGHLGRSSEAIAAFRAALRLRPDHAETHRNLGLALQYRGELAEAEAELRAALRIDPDGAEAHCSLGRMLGAQGRWEEALAELRSGHELGSRRPGWPYPSARWVREAEHAVALSRRPAALKGTETTRQEGRDSEKPR